VPAVAVRHEVRALSTMTGCKGWVDCWEIFFLP